MIKKWWKAYVVNFTMTKISVKCTYINYVGKYVVCYAGKSLNKFGIEIRASSLYFKLNQHPILVPKWYVEIL